MENKKSLSEMTNEELGRLFPIFLEIHNDNWVNLYFEEEKRIKALLPFDNYYISHIGSTSIKSIYAKPIIDILLEIPKDRTMKLIKDILCKNGYRCINEEPKQVDFNKGYTINGFEEKVYHLHLRYFGDNDELYFRDYMNDNLDIAKQYEKLKLSLWNKYEFDRDGYTNAKSEFICFYTKEAKKEYGERYKRK